MSPELPKPWSARLDARARELHALDRWRRHRVVERRDGVRYFVEGAWRLNFCSNDYLGLATQHGTAEAGAGSAHLVCGHGIEHTRLEQALCEWLHAEAALIVGSGYLGNLAAITGLCAARDLCVQDKLNHASLIDAARLAGCESRRYRHADLLSLQQQLKTPTEGLRLVASDAVFSMDGDAVDAAALRAACGPEVLLHLDEAHSVGVLGEQGCGLGMGQADLRLVTFGKALGTYGAALLGSQALIDHLRNVARPTIFTTAIPPALAERTRDNIRIVRSGRELNRLQANCEHFKTGARAMGLDVGSGQSAIFTLFCGSDAEALRRAQQLWERNVWVGAIRPPTVAEGSARLRITLSAGHSRGDIDTLLGALQAHD